jgi:glyoxylase-like metal-dependent hydrolase (beta-lactamase superfamily II)
MRPRVIACVAGLVVVTMTVVAGQGRGGQAPAANTPPPAVQSLHVQGNVWMLVGPVVNAAVQIGDEGVLVVDTMTEPLADPLVAEVKRIAGNKPIRWIINTHVHADHTGGNAKVAAAGSSIIAGNFAGQAGQAAANFAQIIAHENTGNRLAEQKPALPVQATPAETFFGNQHEFFFNDEAVQLIHVPNAHTDGDILVFFRRSDVIATGDLFITTGYPYIDRANGGSINGYINGLNKIIELTIPSNVNEGGTMVVPGHGRLADEMDVVEYRDMVTILRDRIQTMIKRGLTLDQVRAAKPTLDWDPRYGADSGFWTTAMFIEAVYRDLSTGNATASAAGRTR